MLTFPRLSFLPPLSVHMKKSVRLCTVLFSYPEYKGPTCSPTSVIALLAFSMGALTMWMDASKPSPWAMFALSVKLFSILDGWTPVQRSTLFVCTVLFLTTSTCTGGILAFVLLWQCTPPIGPPYDTKFQFLLTSLSMSGLMWTPHASSALIVVAVLAQYGRSQWKTLAGLASRSPPSPLPERPASPTPPSPLEDDSSDGEEAPPSGDDCTASDGYHTPPPSLVRRVGANDHDD